MKVVCSVQNIFLASLITNTFVSQTVPTVKLKSKTECQSRGMAYAQSHTKKDTHKKSILLIFTNCLSNKPEPDLERLI